jgi:hypothetical protein
VCVSDFGCPVSDAKKDPVPKNHTISLGPALVRGDPYNFMSDVEGGENLLDKGKRSRWSLSTGSHKQWGSVRIRVEGDDGDKE